MSLKTHFVQTIFRNIKSETLKKFQDEKEMLQKQLSDAQQNLAQNQIDLDKMQKQHEEYVKKMDAIKAILKNILQIKHSALH